MTLIDQLLNLIGVVLWLSWRGVGNAASVTRGAGTLVSTLKPARSEPARGWAYFAALVALLALRPLLYASLARLLDWTPVLSPGPVAVAFRADDPARLVAYSVLSFAWTMLVFHTSVLLLSVLARGPGEPPGLARWLRELTGRPVGWPAAAALTLPVLLLAVAWAALAFPLGKLGVLLPPPPAWKLAGQALAVGLAVWLPARWLLAGLLLLCLVHEYVYLGEHALWGLVRIAGGKLLRPFAWLPARFGKLDFTPLLAAAAVLALAWALELGLTRAYQVLAR